MQLPEFMSRTTNFVKSSTLAWCVQIATAHTMCSTHHFVRQWGAF